MRLVIMAPDRSVMTTLCVRSALALAVVLASSAQAGYDKTDWGMTLAEVKKLYPGGFMTNEKVATRGKSAILQREGRST
jgi:hypothetical protein